MLSLCDCRDGLRGLPPESVDLTVTSPPYGEMREFGGQKFTWDVFAEVAEELWRVTKPGGVVCWQEMDEVVKEGPRRGGYSGISWDHAHHLEDLGFLRWDRLHTGVCGIRSPSNGRRYCAPPSDLFVLTKGEPTTVNLLRDRVNRTAGAGRRTTDRQRDGSLRFRRKTGETEPTGKRTAIWLYPSGASTTRDRGVRRDFPALMIEALARDLILSYSRPGDLVLDPFAGAATTGKLALLLGRKFLGFEVHPPYHEMGAERLRAASGAAALARLRTFARSRGMGGEPQRKTRERPERYFKDDGERLRLAKEWDFYATDPETVRYLLDRESFVGTVTEPCSGDGALTDVLEEYGYTVEASDLRREGVVGTPGVDLHDLDRAENLITNPPFRRVNDVVEHLVSITTRKCALLLANNFAGSRSRRPFFLENPPARIYPLSRRPTFGVGGRDGRKQGTQWDYCWYVWDATHTGPTEILYV